MHTAMRIDLARSGVGGSDGRFLALAFASGVAGLTVTYPTVTLGNGTVGEWAGRLEIKPPRLAAGEILSETAVTAKFHDAARIAADSARATASNLVRTFSQNTEAISKVHPGTTAGSAGGAEKFAPSANLATSPASMARDRSHTGQGIAPLTNQRQPVPRSGGTTAPLDAVRIALPPAAREPATTGAMSRKATLDPVATAGPSPGNQALAGNSPAFESAIASSATAAEQPFGLLSASRDIREFDLAKLGGAKSLSDELVRSAANVIAVTKPATRSADLSRVTKVPDRVVGDHILHVAELSLEGVPSGSLSVRIGMSGDLSLKLADLLGPVQDQMAPEAFQRLAKSSAASEYVSFAQLRAAGFDIRYDAGSDRLMVSAQP